MGLVRGETRAGHCDRLAHNSIMLARVVHTFPGGVVRLAARTAQPASLAFCVGETGHDRVVAGVGGVIRVRGSRA